MSRRVTAPLEVRLKTTKADQSITREVKGLSYRLTAPGGFHSASVTVPRRVLVDALEAEHYGTLYIYDSRTGRTLWEGRVEDLGRAVDDAGEWRKVTAVGTAAHVNDQERPYLLLDTGLDTWERHRGSAHYMRVEVSDDVDTEKEAWVWTIPESQDTVVGDNAFIRYKALEQCNMKLGGISLTHDSNQTATARSLEFRVAGVTDFSDTQSTTATTRHRTTNNFGVPAVTADLRFRWIVNTASSPTTSSPTHSLYDVTVKALRVDSAGTELTDGAEYVNTYLLAHQVVTDLVGRLLPKYTDPTIDTSATHQIDTLAYLDGITPGGVLNDLLTLEPAFVWLAWEAGKFEWKPWPTAVRYEVEAIDGIDAPSSVAELYNEVWVRWRNRRGHLRVNRRTRTVAVLDDAGLTRSKVLDLADEVGSSTNADRVGDQFLAEHSSPPNTAQLTVARPLYDVQRGMILPQEVRPGELIRVVGINPSVDALNASARNGVTVFKIAGVEVDESGVATLELDSYPRTVAQALRRMALRRQRKR